MADDLDVLWANLSLTEDEDLLLDARNREVADIQEKTNFCLLGKLLTKKMVNLDVFRSVIYKVWKLSGILRVSEMGDKLYLFEFEKEGERDRILLQQPWNYNRSLMVLKEYDGLTLPSTVDMSWCSFWVQLHGLPPAYMTENIGVMIGETIGVVEEVETNGDRVAWGKCLRVRVSIDTGKKLKRGTRIMLPTIGATVVLYKYERLPDFCFICGCMTHLESECDKGYSMKKAIGKVNREYGNWLRAELPRSSTSGAESTSFYGSQHQNQSANAGSQRRETVGESSSSSSAAIVKNPTMQVDLIREVVETRTPSVIHGDKVLNAHRESVKEPLSRELLNPLTGDNQGVTDFMGSVEAISNELARNVINSETIGGQKSIGDGSNAGKTFGAELETNENRSGPVKVSSEIRAKESGPEIGSNSIGLGPSFVFGSGDLSQKKSLRSAKTAARQPPRKFAKTAKISEQQGEISSKAEVEGVVPPTAKRTRDVGEVRDASIVVYTKKSTAEMGRGPNLCRQP